VIIKAISEQGVRGEMRLPRRAGAALRPQAAAGEDGAGAAQGWRG